MGETKECPPPKYHAQQRRHQRGWQTRHCSRLQQDQGWRGCHGPNGPCFHHQTEIKTMADGLFLQHHRPSIKGGFQIQISSDDLSKDDNRQRFNLTVARALVVAHIQRRATMSCHHEPVRQNIACVLKSLSPAEPATQGPPAKCAKRDKPATKQRRCSFCPAKKDRKTKTTCSTCDRHIYQEHAVTRCQNC
ncbi:PiggyBac transposable element-derived protein 4 [Plakobranchus ocellatus]|uniref:PiggyBac transposable element-derived protein 4 n=1 Tax=Plakobranchus ocellatus TaxID=259542 RepID=A0AAV3YYV3_9GAST|nr:PiggyBac transposable element-derived protein 4 [Plakobranchus ocellatus]